MTNYFVDPANGDDSNDGLTMDTALSTLYIAVSAVPLFGYSRATNDKIWIRRNVNEHGKKLVPDPVTGGGTKSSAVSWIGCPRGTFDITSSEWTSGSNRVGSVTPSASWREFAGRFIQAPNEVKYLITYIPSAGMFYIDRPYVGSSTAGVSAQLYADEDYDTFQAIDDSGWTIKKSDWNDDKQYLPLYNVPSAGISGDDCLKVTDSGLTFKNLYLKCSANDGTHNGIEVADAVFFSSFQGCVIDFQQTYGSRTMIDTGDYSSLYLDRCIFWAPNGTKNTQFSNIWSTYLEITNCAVNSRNYSASIGFLYSSYFINGKIENFNFLVEHPISGSRTFQNFSLEKSGLKFIDTKFGGDITFDLQSTYNLYEKHENYQKIYGSHKIFGSDTTITKVLAASAGGDYPEQRDSGSLDVLEIEITYGTWYTDTNYSIFEQTFVSDGTEKSYRYYVQSMAALTATDLWLELDYIDNYGSVNNYSTKTNQSDETVLARSDQGDWTQYIEVPNITAKIGTTIRIRCNTDYSHATNKIYIDPIPVIS